jgi:hypothetical protein
VIGVIIFLIGTGIFTLSLDPIGKTITKHSNSNVARQSNAGGVQILNRLHPAPPHPKEMIKLNDMVSLEIVERSQNPGNLHLAVLIFKIPGKYSRVTYHSGIGIDDKITVNGIEYVIVNVVVESTDSDKVEKP